MNDHLSRLKEELELMSENQPTVTVSRRDIELLIAEIDKHRNQK